MTPLTYRRAAPPRARLGVVLLTTDEALERDLRAFLPFPDLALHHARIGVEERITSSSLAAMEARLPEAVRQLPGDAYDAIGYGCTSASATIGCERVAQAVRQAREAPVTDPLEASLAAFAALGAHRVAMVTPYVPDVSATLRRRIEQAGIEVASLASFGIGDDREVARIDPASVLDAVRAASEGVDATFAACTNLRTAPIIEAAETETGLPLVTSNGALAWRMARLAGLDDTLPMGGRLGGLR